MAGIGKDRICDLSLSPPTVSTGRGFSFSSSTRRLHVLAGAAMGARVEPIQHRPAVIEDEPRTDPLVRRAVAAVATDLQPLLRNSEKVRRLPGGEEDVAFAAAVCSHDVAGAAVEVVGFRCSSPNGRDDRSRALLALLGNQCRVSRSHESSATGSPFRR